MMDFEPGDQVRVKIGALVLAVVNPPLRSSWTLEAGADGQRQIATVVSILQAIDLSAECIDLQTGKTVEPLHELEFKPVRIEIGGEVVVVDASDLELVTDGPRATKSDLPFLMALRSSEGFTPVGFLYSAVFEDLVKRGLAECPTVTFRLTEHGRRELTRLSPSVAETDKAFKELLEVL